MPATPEPIATLKAAYRFLSRPLHIDARRNVGTWELKGYSALLSRLRNQIAKLQNRRPKANNNRGAS
jgi:hypothetical protein